LLALAPGQAVLDAGSGFCWTTEWLLRGGYEAIGVDICRTYLSTGRPCLAVHAFCDRTVRWEDARTMTLTVRSPA
jgi:hypothetical protein